MYGELHPLFKVRYYSAISGGEQQAVDMTVEMDSEGLSWEDMHIEKTSLEDGKGAEGTGSRGTDLEDKSESIEGTLWHMEVGELHRGTQYYLAVGSEASGLGETVWAHPIIRSTMTAPPATAPRNITVVPAGPTSLSVRWLAPVDTGGSQVTQYLVYYRMLASRDIPEEERGGWVMVISQGSGTTSSLSNLDSFTLYETYVVAVNANGQGPRTMQTGLGKTLENNAPVSPPTLLSATFTSLAQGITLRFDSATDRGEANGQAVADGCHTLLSFVGIGAASCSWMSDKELLVTLGGGSTILPGNPITLHAGKLKAMCTLVTSGCGAWAFNQEQAVNVNAPADALSPAVMLTGPTTVGICDNVTINSAASTGSGGRAFDDYTWSIGILNTDGTAGTVEPRLVDSAAAASGANSPKLFIIGTWLQAGGTYAVTLSLRNFLGITSSTVFTLTKLSLPVPTVQIDGGSHQSAFRAAGLALTAAASAPSCVKLDSMRVTYSWFINGETLAFDNTAVGPTKLKLPALSRHLKVGRTSTITAVVQDTNGGSNSADASLTVLDSPLAPVIAGGDRSVGFDNGLLLDASSSLDPDNQTEPIQYEWRCSPLYSTAADCGSAAAVAAEAANGELGSAVLNVPGGALAAGSDFLWEVRVSKDTRVATASVIINVVEGNPVQIGIDNSCCGNKVNPSQKVVIQATVDTGSAVVASTIWSQEAGDLDFSAADLFPSVLATPIMDSSALVIKAGSLTPGAEYAFRLTGTAPGRAAGQSMISFIVNAAPTSGYLVISPPGGTVLDTKFAFEAAQWVDEDTPLQYRFGYVDPAASTDKFVGAQQMNPLTSDVLLPQGVGANSTLVAFVVVLDSLGAFAKASESVAVRELLLSAAELADKTDELLSSALDTQDSAGVFQAIGAIGAMMNKDESSNAVDETVDPCESAPNCAALDREECVANNRCGMCIDGLVPSVGEGMNNTDACIAPLPVCYNSNLDSTETDVDCGGGAHTGAMTAAAMCPGCSEGLNCELDVDCAGSLVCAAELGLQCAQPLKECPVFESDECSAMGQCQYVSITGEALDSTTQRCTVERTDCEAVCSCDEGDEGRYGLGCQMDKEEYQQMVSMRESMLDALVSTESTSEKSPDDLAQQASFVTLLTAVPSELSASSQNSVLGMMGRLVSSSSEGGLVEGMGNDITSSLSSLMDTDLLSQNSSTNSLDGGGRRARRRRRRHLGDAPDSPGDAIAQTLFELSQASLIGAVNGEAGVSISTKNIKMDSAKKSAAALNAEGMAVAPGGDAGGASFAVPGGTLSSDSSASVNSQSTAFTKNPHGAETPDGLSGVKSSVVGLSFSDEQGEIKVQNLSEPIMIVIPNTLPINYGSGDITATFNYTCKRGVKEEVFFECPGPGSNMTLSIECDIPWWGTRSVNKSGSCISTTGPACTYWDEELESWSDAGCVVDSWTADNTTCACTHLTDFGTATSGIGAEAMAVLNQDPRDIFNPATMMKNIVVFATIFSMFGLCLCLMFQGWMKDRSDMKAMVPELYTDNPQGAVDKGALLLGGLFTGMRAARLKARQRYEDICDKCADGKIEMNDTLNRWIERKRKRFQIEDERQKKRAEWGMPLPYLFNSTWELFKRQMKQNHKLLSVWWVFLPSYTRPQRLLMIWTTIIGVMIGNALVYDVKNPTVNCANFSTDWDAHIRGSADDCNGQKDLLDNAMCTWDGTEENEECLYRQMPLKENLAGIILAACITALMSVPVNLILGIGFKMVSPGQKVRKAMKRFDEDVQGKITFEAACRERSFTASIMRGKFTEAANFIKPDEKPAAAEKEKARERSKLPITTATVRTEGQETEIVVKATKKQKREARPLSKASIEKAGLEILEEENKLLRLAGKMPMRKKKGTKKSKKEQKNKTGGNRPFPCCCRKKAAKQVYAVNEDQLESQASKGADSGMEDLPRPAPGLLKRLLKCRLKKTLAEKRWAKAMSLAKKEQKLELELSGLTETQRTARLLEMARENSLNPVMKILYGLNKLPLKRVPTPLPLFFKYIFYLIGFGYVGFAGYFLLAFGVRRGADVTEAWLASMCFTVFQTMFVSWPATVFMMNVALPKAIEPIVSALDVSGVRNNILQHAGDLGGQVELALGLSSMHNGGGGGNDNMLVDDDGMLGGMLGGIAGMGALFAGRKVGQKKKKWAGLKQTIMSAKELPHWGANCFACMNPEQAHNSSLAGGISGGFGFMAVLKQATGGIEYEDSDSALARQLRVEQQHREHVRAIEASDERWRYGVKVMRKIMRVWATDTCGRLLGSTQDTQWGVIREKIAPQGQAALWRAWKNLAEQKLFAWLIEYSKVEARKAETEAKAAAAAAAAASFSTGGVMKVSPETAAPVQQQVPLRWVKANEPPSTMVPPHQRVRKLYGDYYGTAQAATGARKQSRKSSRKQSKKAALGGSDMGAAEAQAAQASEEGGARVYMVGLTEEHLQSLILEYLVERDDALAEYESWQAEIEAKSDLAGTALPIQVGPRQNPTNMEVPLTPRGLEETMENGSATSGYQQQLVAVARAGNQLMPNPTLAQRAVSERHRHKRQQRDAESKSLRQITHLSAAHRRHLEDESLRAELQEMWEEREESAMLAAQALEQLRTGVDEIVRTKQGRLIKRAERQGWSFDPWNGRSFTGSAFMQGVPVALPKHESPLTPQWAQKNFGSEKALDWLNRAHTVSAVSVATSVATKEVPTLFPQLKAEAKEEEEEGKQDESSQLKPEEKLKEKLKEEANEETKEEPTDLLAMYKDKKTALYRELLEMAMADGSIADSEETGLAVARGKYGITDEEHEVMRKEVQAEDKANSISGAEHGKSDQATNGWSDGLLEMGWQGLPEATQRWAQVASNEQWLYDPWTGEGLALTTESLESEKPMTMLAWATTNTHAKAGPSKLAGKLAGFVAPSKPLMSQTFLAQKAHKEREEKEEERAIVARSSPNTLNSKKGLRAKDAAALLLPDESWMSHAEVDRIIAGDFVEPDEKAKGPKHPRSFEC
jgi:hypothetical protein